MSVGRVVEDFFSFIAGVIVLILIIVIFLGLFGLIIEIDKIGFRVFATQIETSIIAGYSIPTPFIFALPCIIIYFFIVRRRIVRCLVAFFIILFCLAGFLFLHFKLNVAWYIEIIPLVPILPVMIISLLVTIVIILTGVGLDIIHLLPYEEGLPYYFLLILKTSYVLVVLITSIEVLERRLDNYAKEYGIETFKCLLGLHERKKCCCKKCAKTFHKWRLVRQEKKDVEVSGLVSYGYDNFYDTWTEPHMVTEWVCITCQETKTESQRVS